MEKLKEKNEILVRRISSLSKKDEEKNNQDFSEKVTLILRLFFILFLSAIYFLSHYSFLLLLLFVVSKPELINTVLMEFSYLPSILFIPFKVSFTLVLLMVFFQAMFTLYRVAASFVSNSITRNNLSEEI